MDKIPREKVEFSLLMHEINVLTNWTILALAYIGWIPWFEQGTYCATYSCSTDWTIFAVKIIYTLNIINKLFYIYVGVIRTLNDKYQKFMTYLLVHNIYKYKLQFYYI